MASGCRPNERACPTGHPHPGPTWRGPDHPTWPWPQALRGTSSSLLHVPILGGTPGPASLVASSPNTPTDNWVARVWAQVLGGRVAGSKGVGRSHSLCAGPTFQSHPSWLVLAASAGCGLLRSREEVVQAQEKRVVRPTKGTVDASRGPQRHSLGTRGSLPS